MSPMSISPPDSMMNRCMVSKVLSTSMIQVLLLRSSRNVIVLRNDEGDKHLPGILTQDPYSLLIFCSKKQKLVFLSANSPANPLIALPQIKIAKPKAVIFLFGAVQIKEIILQSYYS